MMEWYEAGCDLASRGTIHRPMAARHGPVAARLSPLRTSFLPFRRVDLHGGETRVIQLPQSTGWGADLIRAGADPLFAA